MSNNALLFNAALAGAFSGINTSRWNKSTDPANYIQARNEAVSFAQTVDAAIPNDLLTSQQDAALLTSICQQVLSGKGSPGTPAATAIATAYQLARSSLLAPVMGRFRQWATIVGDGATITNTTTTTSLLPAAGVLPAAAINFPAGFFNTTGQFIMVEAAFSVGTAGGATQRSFNFRLGPTANISVAANTSINMNTAVKVAINWNYRWLLFYTHSSATTGSFRNTGYQMSEALIGGITPNTAGTGLLNIPTTPPSGGTGFNPSVATRWDLTAGVNVANVLNTITLKMLRVSVSEP